MTSSGRFPAKTSRRDHRPVLQPEIEGIDPPPRGDDPEGGSLLFKGSEVSPAPPLIEVGEDPDAFTSRSLVRARKDGPEGPISGAHFDSQIEPPARLAQRIPKLGKGPKRKDER